jgi:predicted aspartyl protease
MNEQGNEHMGRVTAEITLANNEDVVLADRGALARDQVRQTQLQGVVDTGATRLVVPDGIVAQLGLAAAGQATVRYADQRTATRPMVKNVWLKLLGRESVFNAIVEPGRTTALVGAIVLEDLDLVVDCTTQTLHPRDPNRIVSEVE